MSIKNKPLVVIFLTVFIDLIGFGIIIPLNPYLAKAFGADALQIGFLMTIYSAAQFLFSPFWGRLSDRVGRRPIILMSLIGAGLSHLLFAFATSFSLLFLARLLAGIFGANISTAMAYIADVTPEKDRSKNMGIIGAAFGLGFVLGPALGAFFSHLGHLWGDHPPLGSSFAAVAAGLICLSNAVLAWRLLPESLSLSSTTQASRLKISRWLLLKKHLTHPPVGTLQVIYFLAAFAMAHMEASLFLLMQDKFGWSLTQAGVGFAYVGLVMVFTQGYFIRRLLPIMGEPSLLVLGLLLQGVGFAGIASAGSISFMALAVTFLGLGTGCINPSITGSISLLTSAEEQGEVMGVNQSLSALGRILGPVSGGWIYRDVAHSSPFWAAGFLALCSLMITGSIFRRIPSKGKALT